MAFPAPDTFAEVLLAGPSLAATGWIAAKAFQLGRSLTGRPAGENGNGTARSWGRMEALIESGQQIQRDMIRELSEMRRVVDKTGDALERVGTLLTEHDHRTEPAVRAVGEMAGQVREIYGVVTRGGMQR